MKKYSLLIVSLTFLLCPAYSAAFRNPVGISMNQAVAAALENNPAVRKAIAGFEAESAVKQQSWAFPQPQLALEYEGMPSGTYFDRYESRKFIFSQEFDFPSNYLLNSQKLGYSVETARQAVELEKLKLTADVKSAYIDALLAAGKAELAAENLTLSNDLMEKAKLRYDLGEEAGIDYLRAKLQRGRAENAVLAAEIEKNKAFERLALLLSGNGKVFQADDIELTDELDYSSLNTAALSAGDANLTGHIRMNMDNSNIKAASKSLSLARNSFLPGFSAAFYKQNLNNASGFWGMEFSMSLPLWFMTDQRGRISEAKARLKSVEWEKDWNNNRLKSELRTARFALTEAEKQVLLFSNGILDEAEQVFELANLRYVEGETSYIDLIFAQQAFIETRREYLEALAEYNKSAINLEYAAGKPVVQ